MSITVDKYNTKKAGFYYTPAHWFLLKMQYTLQRYAAVAAQHLAMCAL